jgi:hypothetical protein
MFVCDLPRAERETAMTLGRRLQLLTANASRSITRTRLDELLDLLEEFIVQAELIDPEERFWILAAGSMMWMEEYCEKLQGEIGGEILKTAEKLP